jgi:hypothetical protein
MASFYHLIKIDRTWTALKAYASANNSFIRYDTITNTDFPYYQIFVLDSQIAYVAVIYTGTVPNGINQSSNDSDKSDFETNYINLTIKPQDQRTSDGYVKVSGSSLDNTTNSSSKLPVLPARANASAPTWTDGYMVPLSTDTSGALRVTGTISASNPSVSTTGTSPPASATYIGGSVTTAAPSYTNGQMSGLSLTTNGLLRIDGSGVTQPVSGTVTANQGGTWTIQPGNTANTTPWLTTINQGGNSATVSAGGALKVDGSAVTQPVSGTVTANIGTTNGLALDATLAKLTIAQSTALGSNTQALVGGSVTTAAPTYTTGQINPLSLTTAGALRIDGSGTTQPVSGTVTANQGGTWNITNISGTISLPTGAATETSLAKLAQTQGSTTSGQSGPLILGAVTTASPTYTTGQSSPLSLDTTGALRITGSISASNPSVSTTGSAPPASATYIGGSVTTAAPSYTTGQMSALSLTTAGALRIDGSAVTQPVSGTVTSNQGTANTLANAWSTKITDATNGPVAVKAASTAAAATDPALVVAVSPNNSVAVTQATASNLNAQVVGPGAVGAAIVGNPVRIGGSDGTNTRNILTDTSGRPVMVGAGASGAPVGGVISNQVPDTTGSGTLNALNATASIAVVGVNSCGMQLAAGTLIGTIVPEISIDGGTTWTGTMFDDPTTGVKSASVVFASSNTLTIKSIVGVGGASNMRVRVSAFTSGTATCSIRGTTILDPSVPFASADGAASPLTCAQIGGKDINGNLQAVATDISGRVTITPTWTLSTLTGISFGQIGLAVNTINAVRATTYTEPASNAQRSVASSSASDTSAGTGARTIKITYYDSTYAGPFTETVTLNGTANVNTVSTTICFIEKIEVVTVGSGGTNAGTISLFGATAGGGGTVGTIAVGDGITYWAHHYVATGKTCYVTNMNTSNNANQAMQFVIKYRSSTANSFELPRDWVRTPINSSDGAYQRFYDPPLIFTGPGRLVSYVKPDNAVTATYYSSFDFYEQ